MEEIKERLKSLDNVQLRTELLKHGEKVGPITLTTRSVFLIKLAQKVFVAEHPDGHMESSSPACHSGETGEGQINKSSDAPETSDLATTPTGRKGAIKSNNGNKEEPSMYYIVILASTSDTGDSTHLELEASTGSKGNHVCFTERREALAFMKKNVGSRLKMFQKSSDAKLFMAKLKQSEEHLSEVKSEGAYSLAAEAEKSAFKGPKIQDLMQLRKLVEKGDIDSVKTTVWDNPRYLITGADTPTILHEGMRHNIIHIGAKHNQAAIIRMVLETILDPDFTKLLYTGSCDTESSRSRRIQYLFDLYLNSPDKGGGETPLHIACKMGHSAIVHCLIMYSATDRMKINKFGEKPEEIICSRYKGADAACIKEEIGELLKGLCLVPLLRSVDNIALPVVGEPCSPDERLKLYSASSVGNTNITPPQAHPHSPKEPRLTLSAYAGPMSPSKARNFQKQWIKPPRNMADVKEFMSARKADAEKGYERIGRKLAQELRVPWSEYWQFLDAFADFSMPEGLQKLEAHLVRQQAQMVVLNAMKATSSDEDSGGLDSMDSSGEESQEEDFYSCDEASEDEKEDESNMSSNREFASDDEGDVFEDHFFDTQSYIFGQKLQLKKSVVGNNEIVKDDPKISHELSGDAPKQQDKQSNENLCMWSYRHGLNTGENEKKQSETFITSDTSHISDASISSLDETPDKPEQKDVNENKPKVEKKGFDELDRSFNTAMVELSDDLETKLIFSPDGKVMPSRKKSLVPDVGICLERNDLPKNICITRRHCLLDVLIKSKKGNQTFLADVLIQSSGSNLDIDGISDDLPDDPRKKLWTNVKVVARNAVVSQYMKRISRPVHLTVGILEPGVQDVAQHYQSATARIVRQRRYGNQPIACYVHGSTASKTDLDVMRAMCDTEVDPKIFPAVHAWLLLVTSTRKESRDSWPSPAKTRHQHHLSMLQKSASSTPHPVSPLVQAGTLTSTPVSRHTLRSNRDTSPEHPSLKGTPRAWLFKSPT